MKRGFVTLGKEEIQFMTQWLSSGYFGNSNSYYCPLKRKFPFLWRMDSVTTRRRLVYPALNLFVHSISPPLIAAPTITAPRPLSLPPEDPSVAVRILVVLVCLLSNIRPKCRNFFPSWNAEKATAWITTTNYNSIGV